MWPRKKRKIRGDELIVRLKSRQDLMSNDSRLLEVSKWVQQNGLQMGYIYDILSGILDREIILLHMPDGQNSRDEDIGWKKVSRDEGISFGVYLIDCDL